MIYGHICRPMIFLMSQGLHLSFWFSGLNLTLKAVVWLLQWPWLSQPLAFGTGFKLKAVFSLPPKLPSLFSHCCPGQMAVSQDPCHNQLCCHQSYQWRRSLCPVTSVFAKQRPGWQGPCKLSSQLKHPPSNRRCHSPNLSRASAIAWFFTMSMSPRPRQKCGKIKNTDFRISLMLFSFWKKKHDRGRLNVIHGRS